MTPELASLFVFAATVAATLTIQAMMIAKSEGLPYLSSARDVKPQSEAVVTNRYERAVRNTLESAAIFIPLVFIATQLGVSNTMTQWGAIGFAAARVLYPFAYAIDIAKLRSLIWNVGFVCLIVFALGILLS